MDNVKRFKPSPKRAGGVHLVETMHSTKQSADRGHTKNSMQAVQVLGKLFDDYQKSTPSRLKIIDAYMVYILLTGVAQFLYCLLVGTFPFNSFLSGFISTVTSFVLASCLRIQVNEENKSEFAHISPERAFADFIFAHVVLHLVIVNFMG
ncbi:hypothetical protein Q1695_008998 [Nippostrongylus brasiliensis]|nr:hypothetical protein Q1695_008998 [Nippostrongylus brasiliensis]